MNSEDFDEDHARLPQRRQEGNLIPSAQDALQLAGAIANQIAAQHIFQRYHQSKAANTLKRQARDLELFAEFLLDAGIPMTCANFQYDPRCWQGITWGIVEGYVQWLLREGYAVSTINSYLSTVRTYAQLAVKAGTLDSQEGILIQSVKGFSQRAARRVNEQRDQTRIEEVTYGYKTVDAAHTVVVNRRNTKKAEPTTLTEEVASQLMTPSNASPQAHRDALLMCLLLEHGLRASEAAILQIDHLDLEEDTLHIFRPKVQGSKQEQSTHRLTGQTRAVAATYLARFYPDDLRPDGPLLVATSRLLKDGSGGELLARPLNRIRISERVAWLGGQYGIAPLSAHDCRHYCATKMARLGYGIHELMAWFGWSNAQTAMRYIAEADIQERDRG